MKILPLFAVFLTILTLVSCRNINDPDTTGSHEVHLSLSGGSTTLPPHQQVWFWADAESSPLQPDYIKAWLLQSDAEGNLIESTRQQYPKGNKTAIDLYGIHGDFAPGQLAKDDTGFPSGKGLTFQVETDQREDAQGISTNHDLSDLLYGIKKGAAPDRKSIDIGFVHLLSNIKVALRPKKGSVMTDDDLKKATVRILGAKTTGVFTPTKDLSQADLTDPDKRAKMLSNPSGKGDIQISTSRHTVKRDEDFSNATYGQAIIIPQEFTGNWLEVTVNGIAYYYNAPFKFESGKSYQFNVTVSDILEVESEVTSWQEGKAEPSVSLVLDGIDPQNWDDGGFEPVVNHVCNPGDYFYRTPDGKWAVSRGYPNVPDPSKGTCIGVVLKEGKGPGDGCTYTMKKDRKTPMTVHGYAVALFDAEGEPGSQPPNTSHWSPNPSGDAKTGVGTSLSKTDFMGYSNTQAIKQWDGTYGKNLQADFPACYYATDAYDSKHPAPDNSSGWFLPSAGQLACACGSDLKMRDLLNQSLSAAGGGTWLNNWYWSSSEYSSNPADYASAVVFTNGYVDYNGKSGARYVRALVAF